MSSNDIRIFQLHPKLHDMVLGVGFFLDFPRYHCWILIDLFFYFQLPWQIVKLGEKKEKSLLESELS